MTFKRKIK